MNQFTNRELSWLQFNERVLEEAMDQSLSLFDRCKFLSIFSSNLDEFFMVRVGSLNDQLEAKFDKLDIAGLTPEGQLELIRKESYHLATRQHDYFENVMEEAKKEGFEILSMDDVTEDERRDLEKYYRDFIFPVLTPLATDAHRPFPLLTNFSIYLACTLEDEKKLISFVQVPSILPRLITIDRTAKVARYVLLEDLIKANLESLFVNKKVKTVTTFRITRNGDLMVDEEGAEDLLRVIESSLQQRRWGKVVRLEVEEGYDPDVLEYIKKSVDVNENDVFTFRRPLDLRFLMGIKGPQGNKSFFGSEHRPKPLKEIERKSIFQAAKERDLFFHLPYDSFDPIENTIVEAANDPEVLAIKMTLYRVNSDSKIVEALTKAALQGKQVTVLVELMARFDEENNIHWARKLERVGANVIYGVPGLKTHSKIFLVVRNEKSRIRRYVHLGTGNYNSKTAKLYTDMSVLTAREDIGSDASKFFNMISGYAEEVSMERLIYAPTLLRKRIVALMDQEIAAAKAGKSASMSIKINSLVDRAMIEKLYEASQAGVKIRLIVRGICSLVAGVEGLSENIEVKSIVGEFLEHERIYCFENAKPDDTFLASADLMTRNLDRRIELMFPVLDPVNRERVRLTFELLWKDSVKSHWQVGGTYTKRPQESNIFAHETLKGISYKNSEELNRELKKILND
ncbi:polyphosphate kinase 1 [Guggenheimella bovis]